METGTKKRSGCLIAVYVLFGLGLLSFLIVGASLLWFASTEQGKRVIEGARESITWLAEAAQAEGTAELREAGCDTALVTTTDRAAQAILSFIPAEQQGEVRDALDQSEFDEMTVVICLTERFSPAAPPCDELAATWTRAVMNAPDRFLLRAQRQGGDTSVCQALYDGDGELVRPVSDQEIEQSFQTAP